MKIQTIQILKYGGLITGSLVASISIKKMYDINSKISILSQKITKNSTKDMYQLEESDYRSYPWSTNFSTLSPDQDWEMRKIKIKGQIGKTRFLVQQEKNGKQGYLIFTGLTTGLEYTVSPVEEIMENQITKRKGLMVCLGWVPLEQLKTAFRDKNFKQQNILSEEESEKEDIFEVFRDPFTGYIYQGIDPEDLEDDEKHLSETEYGKIISKEFVFEGFLRKPEKRDFLRGKVNDEHHGYLGFANLDRMTGFYRFINEGSRLYYLDRSENLKKNKKVGFPLPIDEGNLKREIEDFEKNGIYGKFKVCTVLSGLLFSACLFI